MERLFFATASAFGLVLAASCSGSSEKARAVKVVEEIPALAPPSMIRDWLIQDVCDADPTLDPYRCPGPVHDLAPGERLHYDRNCANRRDQLHDSFPSANDERVIVNTFDYAPFGPFGTWEPEKDGWDVIEAYAPWVSITDTRDPSGLAQSWARWKDGVAGGIRQYDDNWVLLPTVVPAYGDTSGVASAGHQLSWEVNGEPRGGDAHCCRPIVSRAGALT